MSSWFSTKQMPTKEGLYLILSGNIISIALYHKGKDGLWFYVDGEYETEVEYWSFLPPFTEE